MDSETCRNLGIVPILLKSWIVGKFWDIDQPRPQYLEIVWGMDQPSGD
jgi:hypothetical protein